MDSVPLLSDGDVRGDVQQKYPFHAAVWENNIELLRSLLESHKDQINSLDLHGRTPCHLATILGYVECAELLLGEFDFDSFFSLHSLSVT